MRKIVQYEAKPAKPGLDWFKKYRHRGAEYYDDGLTLFSRFHPDGSGELFYPNGVLAVRVYRPENRKYDMYTVFTPGGKDALAIERESQILAIFDTMGYGVVFDMDGAARLSYNQIGGIFTDNPAGLPLVWTWNTNPRESILETVYTVCERMMFIGVFSHFPRYRFSINQMNKRTELKPFIHFNFFVGLKICKDVTFTCVSFLKFLNKIANIFGLRICLYALSETYVHIWSNDVCTHVPITFDWLHSSGNVKTPISPSGSRNKEKKVAEVQKPVVEERQEEVGSKLNGNQNFPKEDIYPIKMICLKLNEFLSLRIIDRKNINLRFSARNKRMRIELGTIVNLNKEVKSYMVEASDWKSDVLQ
ncbi:uncharacterized protein LOC105836553 [Monomorium pharaonis]|uniref:uncharacterized protein LOC105836553 n=1 Tax=Monomorium pharaonis TaxID=307658 RepID=UPI0017475AF9|nr:uncharacterized protein LOC105836553 [Monomorium pharaonis]